MKLHLIRGDHWDEVDLPNPTQTEPKPNVHLAQKLPLAYLDSFEILCEIRPIVQRCWDTFFHSSLFIQFRSNLSSLLSQLVFNGKCMMAAHADTRSHTHAQLGDILVWSWIKLQFICLWFTYTCCYSKHPCVALPLWLYLSFLIHFPFFCCLCANHNMRTGELLSRLLYTCAYTQYNRHTHSAPFSVQDLLLHSTALSPLAPAFPYTLNVILWAPNCL